MLPSSAAAGHTLRRVGVGIDTARYGHYAAFLGDDLQPPGISTTWFAQSVGQLRRGGSAGPCQPGAHESNRRPSPPRPRSAGTTAVSATTLPRSHRAGVAAPNATCQPAASPNDPQHMIDHRTAQNLEDFVHNCLESAARSR